MKREDYLIVYTYSTGFGLRYGNVEIASDDGKINKKDLPKLKETIEMAHHRPKELVILNIIKLPV